MELNVKANYLELERRLDNFQRKQLPFAFANTLNDTAFAMRKQIVGKTFDRAFAVRDKRFAGQSFRVKKAKKRDLHASLYQVKIRGLYRGNLNLHAEGGIKKPRSGHLAVPSWQIKDRRRGRGVPDAWRARKVVNKSRTFVTTMPSGAFGIWQREGKARLPIKRLYTFETAVKIDKNFMFFEDGSVIFRRDLGRNFNKQFDRAIKTAKHFKRGTKMDSFKRTPVS